MERNQDVEDRLSHAHAKLMFVEFALSFLNEHALMGTEQTEGLAFILRDIRVAMGEAVNCEIYGKEPKEKVVKLA